MTQALRQRTKGGSSTTDDPTIRFRPARRNRNRIAAGVALAAVAIGGNVLVYSSLDDTSPVVQVVRDVPAGSRIEADMLRTVAVDVDDSVSVVPADDLSRLVGSYARVRLVAGSLVTATSTQDGPLVEPGNSVVAIRVPDGSLPIGLRERVPVQLVIPVGADPTDAVSAPTAVRGVVVGLPSQPDSVLGLQSLSIEVAAADATVIAAADDVRVVLLAPDPGDE